MKRKIATIDVYVDPDSPDSSGTRYAGKHMYDVTINKGAGEFTIDSQKKFQTVLAHELGHFVGLLSRDSDHNSVNQMAYQMTGNTRYLIPAEKKAWAWAHEMGIDIDADAERAGLGSYENNATWKNAADLLYRPMRKTDVRKTDAPLTLGMAAYYVASFLILAVLAVISVLGELSLGCEVLR